MVSRLLLLQAAKFTSCIFFHSERKVHYRRSGQPEQGLGWNTPTIRTWVAKAKPVRLRKIPSSFSTYQLDVNKTFNATVNDEDLPEFTLYKKVSASGDYTRKSLRSRLSRTLMASTSLFPRVDDGLYKLVETKVPDGFNKADDTYLEIKATHDETAESPALKNLTITVKNVETKGDTATGTVATSVVNKKGSNLPSTGGMGTVMLYVAGIAVFVLAGATLVMALRRRNA